MIMTKPLITHDGEHKPPKCFAVHFAEQHLARLTSRAGADGNDVAEKPKLSRQSAKLRIGPQLHQARHE